MAAFGLGLTDSSNDGVGGIIVVDIASGRAIRRLSNHATTNPEDGFTPVVDGAVLSTDLADGDVETLLGQDVTIDTAGPTVDGAASDPSNIVVTDINLTNGVVHVIDSVHVFWGGLFGW